jgi:hypothetical protein
MQEQDQKTDGMIKPFLAQFAVPRSGDQQIPGHYDPAKQIWVVQGPSGLRPIIESEVALGETWTKTAANTERDDTTPSLAELATKTEVVRERDDPGFQLALETFTRNRERDEPSWQLELETSTKIEPERTDY